MIGGKVLVSDGQLEQEAFHFHPLRMCRVDFCAQAGRLLTGQQVQQQVLPYTFSTLCLCGTVRYRKDSELVKTELGKTRQNRARKITAIAHLVKTFGKSEE
jgi:hypothetical protein